MLKLSNPVLRMSYTTINEMKVIESFLGHFKC